MTGVLRRRLLTGAGALSSSLLVSQTELNDPEMLMRVAGRPGTPKYDPHFVPKIGTLAQASSLPLMVILEGLPATLKLRYKPAEGNGDGRPIEAPGIG